MKVLVLAGGLSHERDVSERSGRRVAEALKDAGHQVEVRDADAGLMKSLADNRPDVVIPLLHGSAGEDGTLREVLSALGIPYVGSTPEACRMAFDKPIAKSIAHAAGIKVPAGVALPHSTFRELGADAVITAVVQKVGLPLVVKPAHGGSSLGVSIVRDAAGLPAALVSAYAYSAVAVIEQFIEGVEVAVSVVDTAVSHTSLPAVEIQPDGGFYDYNARYVAGLTEFFCPARLTEAQAAAVANVAVTAHVALNLRDFSRSDLIVDGDGEVWFLEVNVAPGMTETSLFPQAAAAAGMDLGEVFDGLVKTAVQRGG